jgi:glutathione S-transferase
LKNKSKELLERNPYGKVPVLEDDGAVIYESAVIDEYLDEKYPAVRLMPSDLAERARVRIWVDYCNTRLQRAGGFVAHDYKVEQSKAEILEYLQFLEGHMRGRNYIAGNYSLADITFIPFFTRLERYQATVGDDLPNVKAWVKRLLDRPAVQPTL